MKNQKVLCVYDPDHAGVKFHVAWDHKSQIHYLRDSNGKLAPHCQECTNLMNEAYTSTRRAFGCQGGNSYPEGTYEEYIVERIMYS